MQVKIGTVSHYYNKIGVAVFVLSKSLAVGDTIKISGHDKEFIQKVDSMQMEHLPITKAKKGDDIGLKVDREVKEGDEVYKIS